MKPLKTFILAALALSTPNAMSQTTSGSTVQQFVSQFLKRYPDATLQDIYKGAFQDRFGPAHILTDRKAVKTYINKELEDMTGDARYDCGRDVWDYCEPCGWRANFYRVDLAVLKDGVVPIDAFVDAFMESANGIDTTLTSAWVEEWGEMVHAVRQVAPDLHNFASDSVSIARILSCGKYVVHHSSRFNKTYSPHYRIIRKDVLKRMVESLHK